MVLISIIIDTTINTWLTIRLSQIILEIRIQTPLRRHGLSIKLIDHMSTIATSMSLRIGTVTTDASFRGNALEPQFVRLTSTDQMILAGAEVQPLAH